MAESSILPIKIIRIGMHNEKLAACTVGIHGACHTDDTPLVLDGVVYAVLGNNDYMTRTNDPECRCITVGGIRIVAIHGCQWYGERRWQKLVELGRQHQADLVVFGHTHRRFIKTEGDLWVVNPGSIGDHRRPSYGVLTVEGDKLSPANFTLE